MKEQPFSAEERAALDSWPAPEPPAGFAQRVLAGVGHASRQRRARLQWAAVAAVVVVAVGAWWLVGTGGVEVRGDVVATERVTTQLGKRGVAVSEAGSALSFVVAADGAAAVSQRAGDVFYRVDPGGSFVVDTAIGRVSTVGTCFRVEVKEMKPMHAALLGGVAGAALSAVVLVTVYEGKVEAVNDAGERTVAVAGETLTLGDAPGPVAKAEQPAKAGPRRIIIRRPHGPGAVEAATPGHVAGEEVTSCEEKVAVLAAETQRLRAQIGQLEGAVSRGQRESEDRKTYGLSQEKLQELASKCELRWDHPPIDPTGARPLPPKVVDELGLTAAETEAVQEEMDKVNTELAAVISATWLAMGGDPKLTEQLAPQPLMHEIDQVLTREDRQRFFQKVSAEKAGLAAPPAPGSPVPPAERMFRVLSNVGDQLEEAIAGRIGHELARELRDFHQGWGLALQASPGCPGDEADAPTHDE